MSGYELFECPSYVPHSFAANFVNYIAAKYYLNWFSFYITIMEVIGVNFF